MLSSYEDPNLRRSIQKHLNSVRMPENICTRPPESVTVSDWVWHSALREMDPQPIWPDRKDINPLADSEYPRVLVQAVVDYLSEDLSCDHSVNICMCSTAAVVEELNLNLAGRQTCPDCGGDGHVWNQEAFDAAQASRDEEARRAKEGLIEWRDELWWDLSESHGYEPCNRCDKKGYIEQ